MYLFSSLFLWWKKNIQLWLRTQVGSETYWIGLTDQIRESIWEWRDGSTYYEYLSYVPLPVIPTLEVSHYFWKTKNKLLLPPARNWMEGQPDNFNNEDCVMLVGYNHGQWRDEQCNMSRKFICKHPNGELVTVELSVSQCWGLTSYVQQRQVVWLLNTFFVIGCIS